MRLPDQCEEAQQEVEEEVVNGFEMLQQNVLRLLVNRFDDCGRYVGLSDRLGRWV